VAWRAGVRSAPLGPLGDLTNDRAGATLELSGQPGGRSPSGGEASRIPASPARFSLRDAAKECGHASQTKPAKA
jgi:hypothetical protein